MSASTTPLLPSPHLPLVSLPTAPPRRSVRQVRPTRLQEACGRLEDLAGRLGPGARMPTVQQLRGEIGVSIATLNLALSDLEARGLIRRRHGVGIFVADAVSAAA